MRKDLYEQCSDHITENTPSSTRFGSRPSSSLTRVNSSGVRLWAAITSGVMCSMYCRQKAEKLFAAYCLLLSAYLLIYRAAQFFRLDPAEVLENDLAVFIKEKRRRQLTVPFFVHRMNGRLR